MKNIAQILMKSKEDQECILVYTATSCFYTQPKAVSMHWAELNPGVRLYHLIMVIYQTFKSLQVSPRFLPGTVDTSKLGEDVSKH